MERPDHVEKAKQFESRLSPRQSYEHYKEVVRQQQNVITAASDIKAL